MELAMKTVSELDINHRLVGTTTNQLRFDEPARPAHARQRTLLPTVGRALPLASTLVVFNLAVLADSAIAGRLYALGFLLIVPGTAALALTPLRTKELSVRLAWSVGASLLVLMLLGLAFSLVLPHLGVARPLSRWPVVLGVDVVTLGCGGVAALRRDPLQYLLSRPPRRREVAIVAAFAMLVLAAMAGAERLNNGYSGDLATAVLVAIGLIMVALVAVGPRVPTWTVSVAVYAITASSLLMSSMRSNYTFGYDIQSEFQVFSTTLRQGAWHIPTNGNAYASMLSITILPTVGTVGTHISGTYVFKFMYPLVFSFFPVLVLVTASRFFSTRSALVGALVVIGQGLYAADITGLARQEIGLVYFALFVVTAFDENLPPRVRQAGATTAGVALAFTHYSSAYFAAIVLVIGYLIYALLRVWHVKPRQGLAVLTVPVVLTVVGAAVVWNVAITHSAGDVLSATKTIEGNGPDLVPGSPGESLLQRFLNADVTSTDTAQQFAPEAAAYYAKNDPFLHPFPLSLTARYPVESIEIPVTKRAVPAAVGSGLHTAATVVAEILLLLISVGVLALLWRERRVRRAARAECAALALGCLVLLGLLRLSGTISTLYNPPRGQVQGAPLLSVGLAFVCTWLFSRRRLVGSVCVGVAAAAIGILLVSGSGLGHFALGGDPPASLVNYGDDYQSYYFTDADLASASWLVDHYGRGDVVYADTYGELQIYHFDHLNGLISTVIPEVIEPGAFVFATSTNITDGSDRSTAGNGSTVVRFPTTFLNRVDDVVFATSTTRIYR
jgi:uncharacterized membrane protein